MRCFVQETRTDDSRYHVFVKMNAVPLYQEKSTLTSLLSIGLVKPASSECDKDWI